MQGYEHITLPAHRLLPARLAPCPHRDIAQLQDHRAGPGAPCVSLTTPGPLPGHLHHRLRFDRQVKPVGGASINPTNAGPSTGAMPR